MITACLEVKQEYHSLSNGRIFGEFTFATPLIFEIGLTWVIGREPFIDAPAQKAIYIASPCVTRSLGRIYSSRVGGKQVHILEVKPSGQGILFEEKYISKRILESGDKFVIEGTPVYFTYKQQNLSDDEEETDRNTQY